MSSSKDASDLSHKLFMRHSIPGRVRTDVAPENFQVTGALSCHDAATSQPCARKTPGA
ncbi:uncharacterized protein Bfra_011875 [Botrytis fragariae]|uniref:Uncharacterized protein n=1 Tax=Botrytis fragariae TaxID=1964551 RepID=A0A8H6AKE5_9HELO|nr:uncharacterized protein Bfra_011875 [Botrytis fragariae]KAF5868910.1 hypothetical protein Bfra_011875 [Botrytis fragariae]